MRKTVGMSIALHAAVILWAASSFPAAREFRAPPPASIPVEIVTPSKTSKLKSGRRKAKPDKPASRKSAGKTTATAKRPKARKRRSKTARAAPRKRADARTEVAPKRKTSKSAKARKPLKSVKKKPATKPKPKKKVKARKPAKSRSKRPAAKRRKNFDTDRIAALLNKVPDAGSRAMLPDAEPAEPSRGHEAGRDRMLSLNEIDALRSRISQCWSPPVGGMGADRIKVKLRLRLSPDGSLTTAPQIVNRDASPFFQAAADSAVRAVLQCQPYQLPPAKYAVWNDMVLNFDPREMFGG